MKKLLLIVIGMLVLSSMQIQMVLAETPGVTKDTITVGAIRDMSGPAVYEMTNWYYGQLAYFKKAYDDGIYKRKIKVISEDGSYHPAKHLAAAKLLLDRDKVFCFIL